MQIKNNKVKLAIFDVNQTIFKFDEINKRFKEKGFNTILVDKWFTNILKEGFALSCVDKYIPFKVIAFEELKKIIINKRSNISEKEIKYILNGFQNLKPRSDIKKSFELLKNNKIEIVTLTNGPLLNSINLLKKNSLFEYVKECFSIEQVKSWKPNPKPYLNVLKNFDFLKSEIVMIAAHAWDLEGAKNIGIKTAYIKQYEKYAGKYYSRFNFVANNSLDIAKKISHG